MQQDRSEPARPRTPAEEISQLRAGGPDVLAAFYRQYGPTVLAWAIRLGGPHIDPEAVSRRAFARALRRLGHIRGGAGLRGWLFSNLQIELRRARRRAWWWRLLGRSPSARLPAGAEGVHLRRRRRVQDALERLPAPLREVVVLVDLEERTVLEAAALLGITPDAVLYSLARGRPRLQKAALRAGVSLGGAGGGQVLRMPDRASRTGRETP